MRRAIQQMPRQLFQHWSSIRYCLQCFDTVGWAAERASGL